MVAMVAFGLVVVAVLTNNDTSGWCTACVVLAEVVSAVALVAVVKADRGS